jgi:hypothetical protein
MVQSETFLDTGSNKKEILIANNLYTVIEESLQKHLCSVNIFFGASSIPESVSPNVP